MPRRKSCVVALVKDLDQPPGDVFAADLLPLFQQQQHAVIGLGRAQAVDAADRGDDDGVAPLKQRAGGGEPELVQFLIDGGFFLDVEVAGRNVGLGLVVVVVGNEILDRIAGKNCLELVEELGSQGLIVGQDQRRAIRLLDDLGHGEGLARAGDPEQGLVLLAGGQPGDEFLDRAALVAAGTVIAD